FYLAAGEGEDLGDGDRDAHRWVDVCGHASAPRSRTPWERRRAMSAQYRSSFSTPIAWRPVSRAASSVEPLPAKGSRIVAPGRELVSIMWRSIAPGFSHGCLPG